MNGLRLPFWRELMGREIAVGDRCMGLFLVSKLVNCVVYSLHTLFYPRFTGYFAFLAFHLVVIQVVLYCICRQLIGILCVPSAELLALNVDWNRTLLLDCFDFVLPGFVIQDTVGNVDCDGLVRALLLGRIRINIQPYQALIDCSDIFVYQFLDLVCNILDVSLGFSLHPTRWLF